MNFQIQQTYPSPNTGLNEHNKLTYAQHINSLVLYGQQKLETNAQGEQSKKKIAFKASKVPQLPTTDKISVYSIGDRKWNIIQAKGKIPTSRTQFECIYMNPCMIMYGGKVNGKNVNEVFALNCSNWTWKKLFSLDGPTAGEYLKFFKISNTTAGLINSSSLWLFYVADVKWQLSSNELPGSVWQKINVNLPQNIKFCWPINTQKLLIIGEKKTICINLQTKQSINQFSSNFLVKLNHKNEVKIKDCHPIQTADSNQSKYCLIATQQFIYGLKFLKTPKQSIQIFNWRSKQYIQLNRQIKCCAIVVQKNFINKQIFYVDIKGQLISVRFQLKEQVVQNFGIQAINSQIIKNNTSCIEQQQNEQSSVLITSNNSRVQIERNQNNHNNGIYQPEGQLINSRLTQKQRDSNYRENLKTTKQNYYPQRNSDDSDQQRQVNYTKQTNIQLKQEQNTKNHVHLQMNSIEKNYNQRFKYKTQQYTEIKQQKKLLQNSLEQERHHNLQANILKEKLSHILYNETIKRKLLQNKVQALQSIIKKSQKFVLMLCKYGNNNQKQKHIEKVKKIRQQLQWNWSKQIYYRKQMQSNKLPNQLSQRIYQTISHIQF